MSPLHKSSLVECSEHSEDMLRLLDMRLDNEFIGYVIQCTVDLVDSALKIARAQVQRDPCRRQAFSKFATNVIRRSQVKIPVLLAVLVYTSRSKGKLAIQAEEWACERVFLGALMVASKFLNDHTLRNIHWAICTGFLGQRDVGRIEREFYGVLQWDLSVSEAEILLHHDAIAALYRPQAASTAPIVIPQIRYCCSDENDSCGFSESALSPPVTPPNIKSPAVSDKSSILLSTRGFDHVLV